MSNGNQTCMLSYLVSPTAAAATTDTNNNNDKRVAKAGQRCTATRNKPARTRRGGGKHPITPSFATVVALLPCLLVVFKRKEGSAGMQRAGLEWKVESKRV